MKNRNEIGLDIDEIELGKKTLRVLRILRIKGKYRLSSSRRGYHFKLKVRKHTIKESLLIRYMFNDCYGRLSLDIRRINAGIKTIDLLFNKKNNKESGKWKAI